MSAPKVEAIGEVVWLHLPSHPDVYAMTPDEAKWLALELLAAVGSPVKKVDSLTGTEYE